MDSAGDSSSSSPFHSFKSKKILRSFINKQHSADEAFRAPDQIQVSEVLSSVSQLREAAKQLRISDLKPPVSSDPLISSATRSQTLITKQITSIALPERYELLDQFFNSMQSSIRILRLKGYISTFTNISRAVESLTDRRFTYSDLAQLVFILPEGIEIKKILLLDEQTSCMKPDLHVTLNFSFIQNDEKLHSDSKNIQMNKLFRSRLVRYYESDPEGDEVLEDELPEPFNQSIRVKSSVFQDTKYAFSARQPVVSSSHLPQSFRRRFSKEVLNHNATSMEQESKAACEKLPETRIKRFGLGKRDLSSMDTTPTPFGTPAEELPQPMKGFKTQDEDSKMSPNKLPPRKSRRKLNFDTPVQNKMLPVKNESSDDDNHHNDILSRDLFALNKEKEQQAISEAKWRKQMIAALPKLFDSLLFVFLKRSVMTKEELVQTLISTHLKICDRREVDEQLRLLQELAPEWIHQNMASSGDLVIRFTQFLHPYVCIVDKISSPESIHRRLSEAI